MGKWAYFLFSNLYIDMVYKYRSTCRFPILIMVNNELLTIRPNQVIESNEYLSYTILKKIENIKPRPRKSRKSKTEVKNGNNSSS